jgi:hypothetical protein
MVVRCDKRSRGIRFYRPSCSYRVVSRTRLASPLLTFSSCCFLLICSRHTTKQKSAGTIFCHGGRSQRSDAAEYCFQYIDQVSTDNVVAAMVKNSKSSRNNALVRGVTSFVLFCVWTGVCGTRSDYPHSPHRLAANNLSHFINSFRAHFGISPSRVKAFSKTAAARRESLIQ